MNQIGDQPKKPRSSKEVIKGGVGDSNDEKSSYRSVVDTEEPEEMTNVD